MERQVVRSQVQLSSTLAQTANNLRVLTENTAALSGHVRVLDGNLQALAANQIAQDAKYDALAAKYEALEQQVAAIVAAQPAAAGAPGAAAAAVADPDESHETFYRLKYYVMVDGVEVPFPERAPEGLLEEIVNNERFKARRGKSLFDTGSPEAMDPANRRYPYAYAKKRRGGEPLLSFIRYCNVMSLYRKAPRAGN